jgi:hypothetical protein
MDGRRARCDGERGCPFPRGACPWHSPPPPPARPWPGAAELARAKAAGLLDEPARPSRAGQPPRRIRVTLAPEAAREAAALAVAGTSLRAIARQLGVGRDVVRNDPGVTAVLAARTMQARERVQAAASEPAPVLVPEPVLTEPVPAAVAPVLKRCPCPAHEGERMLPVTEFYANHARRDGLESWCKTCATAATNARKRAASAALRAAREAAAAAVDANRVASAPERTGFVLRPFVIVPVAQWGAWPVPVPPARQPARRKFRLVGSS